MRRLSKIMISWSILFTLVFSLCACAASNADSGPDESIDSIFSCEQVTGNSGQSIEELFSSTQTFPGDDTAPSLSDINIAFDNGLLELYAVLSYKSETIPISTSGQIYKNEKTERSGVYGNLVLAELEDIDGWHFVQLRIDRDRECMTVILQNTSDYELIQFLIDIDSDDFDMFYNLQDNSLIGTELEMKIIELYSVSRNLLNERTPQESGSGEAFLQSGEVQAR